MCERGGKQGHCSHRANGIGGKIDDGLAGRGKRQGSDRRQHVASASQSMQRPDPECRMAMRVTPCTCRVDQIGMRVNMLVQNRFVLMRMGMKAAFEGASNAPDSQPD